MKKVELSTIEYMIFISGISLLIFLAYGFPQYLVKLGEKSYLEGTRKQAMCEFHLLPRRF